MLQGSIALLVFSAVLQAAPGDLTYLLRRPSLLVRSLLAMNVVMPVLAALIAGQFHLRPQVELALILLAVSPVPPILPGKQGKAGGNVSYALGLLVVAAIISIVAVPASVTLIGRVFGRELHVPMAAIAAVVVKSVLGPVVAGLIVKRLAPALAARLARSLSLGGTGLLVLGLLPVLITGWPALAAQMGDFTMIAIVLFVSAGLLAGHLLGGPAPEGRTVLALSTASRHPAVAIAAGGAIVDADQTKVVAATVLLSVIVGGIATIPYVLWRKGAHAAAATAGPQGGA